ncbi:MAG: hypothetical protein ABSD20_18645, partial [Terriglobales bacterium]
MTKKWRMTVRVLAALMGLAVAAGAAAQTNLGTVKAGSSASGGVNVTLSAAGTLGKINVLTQGVPQMDFTDAGGDGCAVGTVYAAGATCSVNVKFAPLYAGLRMGAVVLADASGNVLGTAYVTGTGLAGQLAFWPGAGMAYLSACGWDSGGLGIVGGGVAVDAAGNVYMTCPKTAQIFKEAPQLDGSWVVTQIVLNIGGPSGIYDPIPAGIAIDGAGNLYITDSNLNRVVMEVPAGSGYVEEDLSISGIAQPEGIAVDGSGNLYIADYFNQRVVEEVRTGSGYTSEVLATQLTRPVGIAVDAAGDVFVTAPVASAVYELTNCNGTCSVKLVDSFDLANGVTVDAVGNFYVLYEEGIAEEVPSSSGF